MTVSELIERLKECHPDADVKLPAIADHTGELLPQSHVRAIRVPAGMIGPVVIVAWDHDRPIYVDTPDCL